MLHPPMLSHPSAFWSRLVSSWEHNCSRAGVTDTVKLRYWYYEAHEAEDSEDEDWHDGLYLNLFLDYLVSPLLGQLHLAGPLIPTGR